MSYMTKVGRPQAWWTALGGRRVCSDLARRAAVSCRPAQAAASAWLFGYFAQLPPPQRLPGLLALRPLVAPGSDLSRVGLLQLAR
jgi:hypothetical protein